ncbi:MAG: heparinase II/III family protein [Phycisphaerales bacterium]|nr:heparinase II/III family protein [Phycisphaerales bacterium]
MTDRLPWIAVFVSLLVLRVAAGAQLESARHPRLLVAADDVPRLRHACGIAGAEPAPAQAGRFGRHAPLYRGLREHFAERIEGQPLAGELAAAALLQLIEPDTPAGRRAGELVRSELSSPHWVTTDPLELVLALDWSWDILPVELRRTFVADALERIRPLDESDSPLDPRRFREKLFGLALAVVVDERDDPSAAWRQQRDAVLDAARDYFALVLPVFVEWRTLSPTSPAAGPREESLTALAIELSRHALGREAWSDYADSVGRWLEHYWLATLDHPALRHNFVRDDGTSAPLTPASESRELLPLTAHLIAARTRDPVATLIADRVTQGWSSPPSAADRPWLWVPIVADVTDCPRAAATPPAARFLGGAVVFRGGSGPDTTAVWIDAAQPFLRRRQHYDAGHFLVYRGGRLAVDAGDDVVFDAIPSKGGQQRLGPGGGTFNFDQFLTASIAHNTLLVWDAAWAARWYGADYAPVGGQRLIEGTCEDFRAPLERQGRSTGRTLAYGTDAGAGYLALDLADAYDDRAIRGYTREFIFTLGRVLVIVDRVTLATRRTPPTWVIQTPSRPLADGRGLSEDARVGGTGDEAGVWRVDGAEWLRWNDRDGSLWMHVAAPTPRKVRAVGGPARQLVIPGGPLAGRAYVGGDPNGFERLVIPAERRGALNAWFTLGAPTTLGPAFGVTPHWGRIEVEPAALEPRVTFVVVLVADSATARRAPQATLLPKDDVLELAIEIDGGAATLRLPRDAAPGGLLETNGPRGRTWQLPVRFEPDPPAPRP